MSGRFGLALSCAILLSAPVAGAESVRDPLTLLARFKAAVGGNAWDSVATVRSRGALRVGGLEGTYEAVEDLGDGRSHLRFELGVARGEQGFDGVRPWERAPGGEVLVKDSPAHLEAARTEAYRTARAFWYPQRWAAQRRYAREATLDGRRCHVLVVHPRGGREFELWLDAETNLLVRTVEHGAVREITTTYADWRSAGSVKVPYRTVSSSGHGDAVTTVEAVEIESASAPAALFARPTGQPEDFTIASGASSTTVPFELVNNHIYLQARIDGGEPRRFLVDSGGVNLLTRDAAAALGIVAQGALDVGGVGDHGEQAGFARLRQLELGGVAFQNPLFIVLPLAGVAEANGVSFDGLVGYELFQRFVVTIDYAAGQLTLTRPEARSPAAGTEVPFRFEEHRPIVEGTVDGVATTLMIDTGSRGTLTLHRPFVEKHHLVRRFAAGPETVTGWGLGGPARGRPAGERTLSLGAVSIGGVATELSTQEKGAMASGTVGGNVGGGVLKRFTVTFDYPRRVMVLAPNGLPADPPDRSGLWLNLEKGGAAFRVEAAAPGSPAAVGGLETGDRVLSVDGKGPRDLTLPRVRELLRRPVGTIVRLLVEKASGEPTDVTLKLADLR